MLRKIFLLAASLFVLMALVSCEKAPVEDPLIPGPDSPGEKVILSEAEIAEIVDRNLDILVKKDTQYSLEGECINDHPEAFSAIVALGEDALPYLTELGQNVRGYDYSVENYQRILARYAAYTIQPELYTLTYPSPDGKYVLKWAPTTFVTMLDPFMGTMYNISVIDIQTGKTAIACAEFFEEESSLHWSPDSRYAAVSAGYRHSYRDVYVFYMASGDCILLPGEEELETLLETELTYYDTDTDMEFSYVHILFEGWGTDTITAGIMLSSAIGGGVEIGSYTYDLAKREITSCDLSE